MNGVARIVVVGGSGFVGRAVTAALELHGVATIVASAPRLVTRARSSAGISNHAESVAPSVRLPWSWAGIDAIVNCAGIAAPGARDTDQLYGANALLPGVLNLLRAEADVPPRFVHLSTAAVQGRANLDETGRVAPWNPYSASKALGEAVVSHCQGVTIYRATSVHGLGRRTTRSLVRLAQSPWASVAARGDLPTPQALVEDVGDAIAFTTLHSSPPAFVLHPEGGLSTAELLRVLGGHEPWHVPTGMASALLWLGYRVGREIPALQSQVRRIEMLWFGQRQGLSWLTAQGWEPISGKDAWRELGSRVQ